MLDLQPAPQAELRSVLILSGRAGSWKPGRPDPQLAARVGTQAKIEVRSDRGVAGVFSARSLATGTGLSISFGRFV